MGVDEILRPTSPAYPSEGDPEAPLQALIFDSVFNSFRGINCLFQNSERHTTNGDHVKFFNTGHDYHADEIGVAPPQADTQETISAGEVGYISFQV
jgi:GTP-binding protein LepA